MEMSYVNLNELRINMMIYRKTLTQLLYCENMKVYNTLLLSIEIFNQTEYWNPR